MNILHLSDTTLSGSPIRIVNLLNKSSKHKARHIVADPITWFRTFQTDMQLSKLTKNEVLHWLNWADLICYHNRWKRQKIFTSLGIDPPKKPSLIQIHSPRESENFSEEVKSGLPIAPVAQFHCREWPNSKYVLPNVVDITDPIYSTREIPNHRIPVVSYAPSNWNCKGWNDKGYGQVAPILKRLKLNHTLEYQLIISKPHKETMELKRIADIGIDDIVTGSYHLSSLEYLAMGICCFCYLDKQTEDVVRKITGCTGELPWLKSRPTSLRLDILNLIKDRKWIEKSIESLKWMKTYWSPEFLTDQYERVYGDVIANFGG